jgi:hypothetical protein
MNHFWKVILTEDAGQEDLRSFRVWGASEKTSSTKLLSSTPL